jgi:hypothetical protein
MADSGSAFDLKSIWDLASKGSLPFLKQYAQYKVPEFSAKGIEAPAFDPFSLAPASSQQKASGKPNLEPTPDLSKYGIWSPEDALRYQQAYGDMATQQAATAWRDVYQPGINQAKLYDLQLQKAGLNYRENSPTAMVQRGFLAAQNLGSTMAGDAAASNALANQLIASKQPARIGYTGQTFTA